MPKNLKVYKRSKLFYVKLKATRPHPLVQPPGVRKSLQDHIVCPRGEHSWASIISYKDRGVEKDDCQINYAETFRLAHLMLRVRA